MDPAPRSLTIAALAAKQHGIVTRKQLLVLGLSHGSIVARTGGGYLHPVHRGVYAVGHVALTVRARWLAAVLACGSGAALSHRSAAALHGIGRPCLPIEVVRSGGGCPPPGLLVHRSRTLAPAHVSETHGIRVTSPARTLVDLAGVLTIRGLEDAYANVRRRRLASPADVFAVLASAGKAKGVARLRSMVGQETAGLVLTRSELEARFLRLCREAALPVPEVNVTVGWRVVDFLWREAALIVELDGAEYHHHRVFEDQQRDLEHLVNGFRTIRVSHRTLELDGPRLVARIRTILTKAIPVQPAS